ncbi:hypothetical protein CEUSTIGMA_g11547.t1 [Chlamydomonas eustigma]|uniref:histidine kinase n=1 Tax=Chlamydomonas eustigma TaxID=1157962 RepID=A0A250XM27_9CHLO|nr:hypothetical protein CEUSTIGMA_g11547.t1 [Chlamydomonas eustigma]|eukprot:GAX84124.1 hypothetical protein CEUSTIGMA_g11547.t1 [Chlamydomonas eustigma]
MSRRQRRTLALTVYALLACVIIWLFLSCLDSWYTPKENRIAPTRRLILSYQWCMVGYLSNLILTLIKLVFEDNGSKLAMHLVSCYVNFVAAWSYYLIWSGFSPMMMDQGSCLYLPQRWLLYLFTAPHLLYLLSQMSACSTASRTMLILENAITCAAGGIATMPWLSQKQKVIWYIVSCAPFPFTNMRIWSMVTEAMGESLNDLTSRRALHFMRVFSIITWNMFPVVYFTSIDGWLPVEVIEAIWACLDWLAKMVYSSSLMEANFFTIAHRRELMHVRDSMLKQQEIEQLNKDITRKDDFLSTMSHELRTPLNGIIGLSEALIIGSSGELPEKALQTISTIKMSGKRLLQLINDILDAAKMKQGGLVIKHQEVNVKQIMRDVMDITKSLLPRKVSFIDKVGDVPNITADSDRLVQIMYNLIGNAAKFTRTGSITLSGGTSKDGMRIFLAVTDTGLGIPKDKFGQIFGAFEQVDMSTTRSYGGTGLGLHLVKQLIEAHNGDISVESEMGVGSTFTVWLPIKQVDSEALPPVNPDVERSVSQEWDQLDPPAAHNSGTQQLLMTRPFYHEKHGGQHMVLSVDDDHVNQMVVDSLLSPEGFHVEQAMNGDEALEFLEESPYLPDLILLDIMMPAMSGYEVCQTIRKKYKISVLPIIMLSAKNTADAVNKGLEMGANDYIKKPFDREELIGRIRMQIRTRDLIRQSLQMGGSSLQ